MPASTTSDDAFGSTLLELSGFIGEVTFGSLPDRVVEVEKLHVLDTLGCMLYGSSTPWVRKLHRAIGTLGETGPASLVGRRRRVPASRAALVNGTAAHAMDFDDHCQEAGVHAGSATVPVALAIAELTATGADGEPGTGGGLGAAAPIDGRTFLAAVATGVEVGIRSGYGVGYGSVGRGWHIAGWTGAFAGAATAGQLAGLDRRERAHALAVAGTQGCGLLGAQYGADVKRFHMGKAAEAGLLGAVLAGEGFTGDARIFEDRYGAIGPTMSDDYDEDAVVENLGDDWRLLEKLTLKPFPSVGQVHAPVEAVREVLDREGIAPSDVDRVTVRATRTVKDHVGWEYEPAGVMAAQANIQYAVARLLVDGRVTIHAYTPEAIGRSAVLERIGDIDVVVDEDLEDTTFGSIVEVSVGTATYEHGVETPRGYPENPMSDDAVVAKFREQAGYVIDDVGVDRVVDLVSDLEALDDVTALLEACRPARVD